MIEILSMPREEMTIPITSSKDENFIPLRISQDILDAPIEEPTDFYTNTIHPIRQIIMGYLEEKADLDKNPIKIRKWLGNLHKSKGSTHSVIRFCPHYQRIADYINNWMLLSLLSKKNHRLIPLEIRNHINYFANFMFIYNCNEHSLAYDYLGYKLIHNIRYRLYVPPHHNDLRNTCAIALYRLGISQVSGSSGTNYFTINSDSDCDVTSRMPQMIYIKPLNLSTRV